MVFCMRQPPGYYEYLSQIPQPPLIVQEEIVAEIEKYQKQVLIKEEMIIKCDDHNYAHHAMAKDRGLDRTKLIDIKE